MRHLAFVIWVFRLGALKYFASFYHANSSLLDRCRPYSPSKQLSRCEPHHPQKTEPPFGETLADLADYQWLTGPQAGLHLAELATLKDPVHRQLSRLRKTFSAEQARLVVSQLELRQRAIPKFGKLSSHLFLSDLSLQQATDLWIARYKASRVAHGIPVVDYCCGLGGDLLAFAERGPTTGWDRAAELVHLANANLAVVQAAATSQAKVGLVEQQPPSLEQIWHLDPDRRSAGRRSTQIEWHSPGPELVERLLADSPNGILKLAPATLVPTSWADQAQLEWVTRDRECRQQIVWFGALAGVRGERRATTLQKSPDSPETFIPQSFTGAPAVEAPLTEEVSRYVYDTDPAIRAAGLTGALAIDQELAALSQNATYLTSDRAAEHPLLACFEVVDALPLRVKILSQHLRSLKIGQLEIKKRGVETSPEQLRQQLKLRGSESATLLLTQVGKREIALLARRC